MSVAPAIGDYESLFLRFQENERLRAAAAAVGLRAESMFVFVCECGDLSCVERVRLTLDQFDDGRLANVALVTPDHAEAAHTAVR
jgi:hypothetical protein